MKLVCRFLIGREKDAANSEVARLIEYSLEQDRRRMEREKAAATKGHEPSPPIIVPKAAFDDEVCTMYTTITLLSLYNYELRNMYCVYYNYFTITIQLQITKYVLCILQFLYYH